MPDNLSTVWKIVLVLKSDILFPITDPASDWECHYSEILATVWRNQQIDLPAQLQTAQDWELLTGQAAAAEVALLGQCGIK